jgi:SagB-type dehydrogenase family enzyme
MHEVEVYNATGLTSAAEQLPELTLPVKPRFVEDLLCLPHNGGYYVLGAEPQFLGGATIGWVFEKLVPQLRGLKTVDEIANELPDIAPRALTDVLTLLLMHGMIEEGAAPFAKTPLSPDETTRQATYYSRYLRITGRYTDRDAPLNHLAETNVCIALLDTNLTGFARALERNLVDHGIGHVFTTGNTETVNTSRSKVDLLIALGVISDQRSMNRPFAGKSLPTLFVDPQSCVLGPYTIRRVSACPDCVRLQIGEQLSDLSRVSRDPNDPFQLVLVQRTVQRALCALTGIYGVDDTTYVEKWDQKARSSKRFSALLPLPNCPSCGVEILPRTQRLPSGHQENVSMLFHRGTSIKPWDLGSAALVQRHLQPSILRLTISDNSPRFQAEREIPANLILLAQESKNLSRPSINESDVPVMDPLTLSSLGPLLKYSAGGTMVSLGGSSVYLSRYTASGGNLGSAKVYLIVQNMKDLRTGVYRYDLLEHGLWRLPGCYERGAADARWADAPLGERANAILAVSCDFSLTFEKYGGRGYVYSLLDAGVMAQRLCKLAEIMGLQSTLAWDFNDNAVLASLGQLAPDCGVGCLLALAEA